MKKKVDELEDSTGKQHKSINDKEVSFNMLQKALIYKENFFIEANVTLTKA